MTDKQCAGCKFFAQGKNCSFCANEKQTDTGYKTYVYWNYGCDLFEKGTHQSRADYTESLKQNTN